MPPISRRPLQKLPDIQPMTEAQVRAEALKLQRRYEQLQEAAEQAKRKRERASALLDDAKRELVELIGSPSLKEAVKKISELVAKRDRLLQLFDDSVAAIEKDGNYAKWL